MKPNIIFILTDDQRWDALGYAGNAIIQTPEMDKLAKSGTYFKQPAAEHTYHRIDTDIFFVFTGM